MYVSEDTFSYLREAADERQRRELERRRVALERAAGTTPTTGHGLREFTQRLRRLTHPAPKPLSHP